MLGPERDGEGVRKYHDPEFPLARVVCTRFAVLYLHLVPPPSVPHLPRIFNQDGSETTSFLPHLQGTSDNTTTRGSCEFAIAVCAMVVESK